MDMSTVSANGQVTIPISLRRQLNLSAGDKVLFRKNRDGDTVITNPASFALYEAQNTVRGSIGEDEILDTVMEMRYGDS